MNLQSFSDSNLLNYKINKRKRLAPLNQKIFNSNIGSIFHKKKRNFDFFSPKPDVEEIPAFSFENDRNIKNYKDYINNKSAFVEKNAQNYLRYIKKFKKPKIQNTLNSPYIFYKEKNNNMNYNNKETNTKLENIYQNNNKQYSTLTKDKHNNNNLLLDTNNYFSNFYSNKKKNIRRNYFNTASKNIISDNYKNDEKNKKVLMPSLSSNEIYSIGNNEITNPSSYYQKYDEDYYRYKLEQKKYLDYNYNCMMNNEYKKSKKEPNVNPYNPKNNSLWSNKSDLIHNPIVNPVNHYAYNKYLRKELNMRENEKLKKYLKDYLFPNRNENIKENDTK